MFERNICQFVPTAKTELDLIPLHFVLETSNLNVVDNVLSVYRVYFILEGEGLFKNRRLEEKIGSGDLIFCQPAKKFSLTCMPKLKYFYISYIGLRPALLNEQLKISEENCVFHNVNELISLWKNALPVAPSLSHLRAESVLLYTYSVVGNLLSKEPTPDLSTNVATEMKKHVDAHFSSPNLSLNQLSKTMSYSPKHLSSQFTKQYNITFSKYLNIVRIEHACTLMERGHTSIKTVAFMCGFTDPLYFSKVFKQLKKLSPRQYAGIILSRKADNERSN